MSKYPILDEFKPFSYFVPPINRPFLALARMFMKVPNFLWEDPELHVEKRVIPGYEQAPIEVYILTPKGIAAPAPCLVNFHGGGFVLEGADYHYRLAMIYAKQVGCKVVYPRYRLAPKYPFPVPFEDCYATLRWVYENAGELGIDRERIGVGGDSAGGTLSVSACMMARDRNAPIHPRFQMLVYPFLDRRGNSESAKRFVDTPMWNSSRSDAVGPLFLPDETVENIVYASPVEAESVEGLPPAYVETAEFDCLHDDGILYARRLREAGIPVELNESKGTMHGFDIVTDAPTSQAMIQKRIAFMKGMLT